MDTRTGRLVTDDEQRALPKTEQKHFIRVERDLTVKETANRQITLYAPCACGSGKKFKFCCFKRQQHFNNMNTPSPSIEKLQEAMGIKPSKEPSWLIDARMQFQFSIIASATASGDKHIGTTSEMVMTFERPDGTRYLVQAPVLVERPALAVTKSAAEILQEIKQPSMII